MKNKKVSVIIPLYNQKQYVGEAIESVLAQTYPNIEIIVVNDGSTDSPFSVLKKYEKNIVLINQQNKGLSEARNTGIRHASGEYLQFLDADDIILSKKIEHQVSFLQQNKNYGIVYAKVNYFFYNDVSKIVKKDLYHPTGNILEELLKGNFIPIHACLIKTSVIESIRFRTFEFDGLEDWDFWLRLAEKKVLFGYLDRVLALCRILPDSMSSGETMQINKPEIIEHYLPYLNNPLKLGEFNKELSIKYLYGAKLCLRLNRKKSRRYILKSLKYDNSEFFADRILFFLFSFFLSNEAIEKILRIYNKYLAHKISSLVFIRQIKHKKKGNENTFMDIMKNNNNKILIIIPVYNGKNWIRACLNSLLKTRCENYEILVIDDNSNDGSSELIRSNYPGIQIIVNKINKGFAATVNTGFREALERKDIEYIAVLNQDTIIRENWLSEMIEILDSEERIALVTPLQYNYKGTELDSNFQKLLARFIVKFDFYYKNGELKDKYFIHEIVGACFMVKKHVLKHVGLFDDLYFYYGEENCFCRRLEYHGYKIALATKSIIRHFHVLLYKKNEKVKYFSTLAQILYSLKDPNISFKYSIRRYIQYRMIPLIKKNGSIHNAFYMARIIKMHLFILFNLFRIYRHRKIEIRGKSYL